MIVTSAILLNKPKYFLEDPLDWSVYKSLSVIQNKLKYGPDLVLCGTRLGYYVHLKYIF